MTYWIIGGVVVLLLFLATDRKGDEFSDSM